jgi:uncharacterized protein (DUF362 family)
LILDGSPACGEPLLPSRVVISGGRGVSYPADPPFSPSTSYPEYPFAAFPLSADNGVYSAFREGLRRLGLDPSNFGSPQWNPLGCLIRPGDKVLIKPNAVLDRNISGDDPFAVITHPSVIRAALDYAWIALEGSGSLTIADSPQFDSDFENYLALTRLGSLQIFYREAAGFEVRVLDLRRMTARYDPDKGFYPAADVSRKDGDPLGYSIVDLADTSLLSGLSHLERLYGADYDSSFTREHHSGSRHEYCIARSVLDSNVILSIPKLKTHRKVGLTLNIKGLVGINGDKNYLAHYRVGCPGRGGDEYPDSVSGLRKASREAQRRMSDTLLAPRRSILERAFLLFSQLRSAAGRLARALGILKPAGGSDAIDHGDWAGNDTAWRMAVDLLRIALYASPDGSLRPAPARRLFSVVDGIVAGEGEGPLSASPRPEGALLIGFDPVAVDVVAAEYMGILHLDLPMLRHFSGGQAPWSLYAGDDSVRIGTCGKAGWASLEAFERAATPFRLPSGWRSVGAGEEPGCKDREGPVHEKE